MEFLSFSAIFCLAALLAVASCLGHISRIANSVARILGILKYVDADGDAFRLRETPKSVSAMSRLELPRIEKDFPEFHWPEWKQRSQNILNMYLEAIEHRQVSMLKDVGAGLHDEVRLAIEENIEQDIAEKFDKIKFHQTEIARYERDKFICRVLVQMSVEYYHTLQGPKAEQQILDEKEQHRYELEIVYVQDVTAIADTSMGYGVNCPNCGAPISNLGEKFCQYCGTAVEPINIRVWVPNKIKEI